jgi:hypothetical protein
MSFDKLDTAVRKEGPAEVRRVLWDAFLSAVVSGERPLRAVRHPLGFVCLPVLRDDSPAGICVHIWSDGDPGDRLATSNVHCHSWHLLSYVLSGTVHNQTYDLADNIDGASQVFVVKSVGGTDDIIATDRRVDVKATGLRSFHTGEYYEMPAGQFHASPRRGSGPAISVVLGVQSRGNDNLTLAEPGAEIRPAVRDEFSDEETLAIIQDLFPEDLA